MRPRLLRALVTALVALQPVATTVAMAFSTSATLASTPTGQATLTMVDLSLLTAGKRHKYRVEVARTVDEQAIGMMGRRKMEPDNGMIFPFNPARTASFWMENTILSLDLIFVGSDKTVMRIARDAKPFSRSWIDSGGPVIAVIELKAGEAARIGLRPGDKVEYTLPR